MVHVAGVAVDRRTVLQSIEDVITEFVHGVGVLQLNVCGKGEIEVRISINKTYKGVPSIQRRRAWAMFPAIAYQFMWRIPKLGKFK